ncbi:uncharacterized protein VTP21DRAFT_2431 [Calcarisporiella thermophila]|uniref:uncharacterized protein n=1 Tax=Calcarisporiella thermophila TaxID=911321 RepID=UPI003742E8BC
MPAKSKSKPKPKSKALRRSQVATATHTPSKSTPFPLNDHSLWRNDEERAQLHEFWRELDEQERRSLVRIEKEAILRKMKEQQRHSCSCTVCGRKRSVIEEELELLYEAYYEKLEQYAHTNQTSDAGFRKWFYGERQYPYRGGRSVEERRPEIPRNDGATGRATFATRGGAGVR